jgi:hypothetical protein
VNAFLPPFLYNVSGANRKALPDISRRHFADLFDSTQASCMRRADCSHEGAEAGEGAPATAPNPGSTAWEAHGIRIAARASRGRDNRGVADRHALS